MDTQRDAANDAWARAEEGLRRRLVRAVELPAEEWEFLRSRLARLRVPRDAHFLRAGEVERRIGYVARGLFRYYGWREGREVNLGFDCEDRFVSDTESFATGAPSKVAIQALEDSDVLAFERDTLELLYARHPCWERLGRLMAEAEMLKKSRKEHELRCLTSAERYLRLYERELPWLGRVPQYHVASFLGVTPETLSRIRARL